MSVVEVPRLQGQRVLLEPLSEQHSEGMHRLWRAPQVCAHAGPAVDSEQRPIRLPATSRAESDRLLEFWLDRARAGSGFRWAVLLRGRALFIGAVGFNVLGSRSEFAYHFVPDFWGQGYATEASRLALGWAFSNGSAEVEANIEPENHGSIRLAERLGFRVGGGPSQETIRYVLGKPGRREADS